MSYHFLLFFAAAGFSLIITPLIRSFAKWARILDMPGDRKVHTSPVPLLGGVAVFISFNLTVLLGLFLKSFNLDQTIFKNWKAFLLCQIIILGLGVLDDVIDLQPGLKFLFQIVVGSLIVLFGFGIELITNPFSGTDLNLGFFSVPVTILWLVLITNALNLVDGLDGLAAGTALIASMTIFIVSYINQNIGIVLVSLVLAGSVLGFLRYNFYPAKIFLGDSGSLFLGFLLAVISIQGSSKGATMVTVMAPILALGLPIMETLLSMLRRFLRSLHLIDYPTKNGEVRAVYFKGFTLFRADKDHIHHQLLKLGFSQRKAVMMLYGVCLSLSVLAFLSVAVKNLNSTFFMGAILIAFVIGIRSLKYQEFKILENGLLIPIFDFPIIRGRLFLAFFDLAMIFVSAYLSFALVFRGMGGPAKEIFIQSLPFLMLVKIVIFYFFRIYKISWIYSSLEEVLSIVGAILLSSVSAFMILPQIFGVDRFGGLAFFVLDFYILLSLSGGMRLSFRILDNFYKRSPTRRGAKILIYGAGYRGSTVLKELKHNGSYVFSPAGFIDDDPRMRGKTVHGCPVLGSIDDLEKIFEKTNISEIIISTDKIGKDKARRLGDFCRLKSIILRQFEFRFYEFP